MPKPACTHPKGLLLALLPALLLACAAEAPPVPGETAAAPDLAELYRRASDAYEAGDTAAFLAHTAAALELAPGHPRLLYNLACGHALNGEPARAFARLEQLAAMEVYFDLGADPDLESLHAEAAYSTLTARFQALLEPRVRSLEAFRLPAPGFRGFIPEGIAHDPARGTFFIGSVRRGEIVAVQPQENGGVRVSTVSLPGQGLGSVLGMALDPERRALWAVTAALLQRDPSLPTPRRPNALVRFDLEGTAEAAFFAPPEGTAESFNDLAVAPDGAVVVGDAGSGALFRLAPGGDALEVLLPPGTFRSPQGLAFSADGSRLWLADYSRGLFAVDPARREAVAVPAPADVTLLGIDGLARAGEDLIAIQNGVRPHRVLRLVLDQAGSTVISVEVLERAHPAYQEPTLGTVVDSGLGRSFYYVANSQWNRFDAEGSLPSSEELEAPLVLRLPL